jgi:tRNA threonylcarbamoyladenosine biosynthesis protein TsaE
MNLSLDNAEATRALGARLAVAIDWQGAARALVIGLSGDLGAGKTTLVGGLLAKLGHAGAVRSPTYTLIEPYELQGRDYYHCDLYRLIDAEQVDDLGLRDLAAPGAVLLIEWIERAQGRLGQADLTIDIAYRDEGRSVDIDAWTPLGEQILGLLLDDA